jgi:site-specific DNA-methyltransferase (adenine-specific)
MVSLIKNTQNISKSVYSFVPLQDFSKSWTDEELYKKYGLNEQEIAFIEKMIRPMDLNKDSTEEELELSEGEEDGSEDQ